MDENYEPFGNEWKKEMMKFNKKDLIELFKKSCIDNLEYQNKFQARIKQ